MSDGTVKIETSLDNSGIEKDLKKVENTIQNSGKKIQSTMDNVEKSMKKASSSFDGSKIAKQLDSVGKSIDKTNSSIDKQKEKLSKLQQAYEKAGSTKQKDNISKQMETTTANITKLESKLKGLKDKEIKLKVKMDNINDLDGNFRSASVKAVNELDKIEKKAEQVGNNVRKSMGSLSIGDGIIKVGDKISSFGDTLSRNVTLPIVGMGIAINKIGGDFGAQMSRVKAISGATGEEFKKLHDQALQLGADTAFSAKEAASGMENLASAGFSTNETMAAMPGLLDLAASSGESLATSSDIAASTLRGFGLEASQTSHVADVLAKNAAATNAAVADTGLAMKYVAPVAHSMGISLEEVTAAIGELSNSGIKSEQAGTTLRGMLTRLASPSDEAAKAMKQIGFNAFNSQGKLKNLSTIMDEYNKALAGKTDQQKQDYTATIFGQEAMSGMLVLAQGGKKALDDLTNSYKTSDGAAKEMAKTMQDNSKSAIEQMTGSIETAAIKLEEVAAPTIIEIANKVQDLANSFSKLPPEVQKSVIEYGLMAAAAGPVLKIFGGLTSGVDGVVKLLSKLAPVATGATATMAGMAEAGTVGAGGVAALGTSLGGAVAAIAPFILAAAAIGTAGYGIYEELNKQVVPSVDLFADEVKYASETVQTEHGNMQKVVATEMTKISDSTKKAVQSYLDLDNDAKSYLQDLYINNKTITDQIVEDTKTKLDTMSKSVIDGYEKQKNDGITKLQELFGKEKVLTAEEQADILQKTNDFYTNKETKVRETEARINQILAEAKNNNRSLNKDELREIQALQNSMRDNAINALSEQESEAAVILQRMKDYDGRITAEQASEKIKALNDSRDKAIQAANDEYDQKIKVISDMRDNVGSITAEEAEKMIAEAKRQRDETVQAAQDTRNGAVNQILDMNSTISSDVDVTTGNIVTNWERLKNWWNSWQPQPKTVEVKTEEQAVTKAYSGSSFNNDFNNSNMYLQIGQRYTGTGGGEEGPTTLHEHGWEMSTGENELYFLGGGTGILDHQSSVSAMKGEVSEQVNNSVGRIVSKLVSTLGGQNSLLNQVAKNTLETANTGKEGVKVNQKLATDLISNISKSTTGTFSNLQNEIISANDAKTKADKMKVDDNANYARVKQIVDNLEAQIEDYRNKIDETTDESIKKQLQAEQKKLEKEKDIAEKEKDLAKEVAENEIKYAKESADRQVKIAEEKKNKLVRLSEAVTEALRTELQGQKAEAEKEINDELSSMDKSYNSKIAKIEADTKRKSDKIDAELKALEEENNENSREKERAEANNNIYTLQTKMANTASYADKRSLQLQIDEAKKALQEKEDTWNIEDQKAQLEEEKSLLQERSDNRKKSLEEQYNREKEEKEAELKDTQAYYDKLLQEDSINAQARYMLLQGNQEELVALLQSYNPLWQDAGQSLADSLLNGLNSQKESIEQAVNDMLGTKSQTKAEKSNDVAYYYENGKKVNAITGKVLDGYASGTDYNHLEDLYKTNEKGFELRTAGDVAYVSKGAGIKNHMESLKYIDSEIGRQVALMKNSILSEQYKLANLVTGAVSSVTNNSKTIKYDGSNLFNIQELHLHNQEDTEQFFNEAETLRLKKKPY